MSKIDSNKIILKTFIILILITWVIGLAIYSGKRIYYIPYVGCICWMGRGVKYRKQVVMSLTGFWILLMIIYSIRITIPFVGMLNINRDLIAVDSNWHPDKINQYHNDALIYTILQNRDCYVNPDCWYIGYVKTFGNHVICDDRVNAVVNSNDIENISSYIELGFSRATNHRTLYSEEQIQLISRSEVETGVAPKLFIAPDGIESGQAVVFFNDDKGNIYISVTEDG